MSQLRVISVACRFGDLTFSKPAPARHADVLVIMEDLLEGIRPQRVHPDDQGFLLSNGHFAGRKEAYLIASANGQLLPRREGGYDGPELYSEDMW